MVFVLEFKVEILQYFIIVLKNNFIFFGKKEKYI